MELVGGLEFPSSEPVFTEQEQLSYQVHTLCCLLEQIVKLGVYLSVDDTPERNTFDPTSDSLSSYI